MNTKDYFFWVALPPVISDLTFFDKVGDMAEPLIDLRYGSTEYATDVVKRAVERFQGTTVFCDYRSENIGTFLLKSLAPGCRIIFSSVEFASPLESIITEFKNNHIAVGIEVHSQAQAAQAELANADFLVASGYEAYGQVSSKTGLILIQELLQHISLPLILRASVGPQGAAACLTAGCAGCILDSQLLLLDDSGLSRDLQEKLARFSPSDTTVLGGLVNAPCRVLAVGEQDKLRFLINQEKEIFQAKGLTPSEKKSAFEAAISPMIAEGFAENIGLFPVGQGLAFAKWFKEKGLTVSDALELYHSAYYASIQRVKATFPFLPDCEFAKAHKTTYPIVQGPMAKITANPKLAEVVSNAGGLPFVAASGLLPDEILSLLKTTRSVLGGRPFGIGVIGFAPFERNQEQIEAILKEPPDFITIAGGDEALVRRFQDEGVTAYIHAPSLPHIQNFLDGGVKGLIFEGREAGGHVGELGSLILWELGVQEILERDRASCVAIRALFAGGIADERGALAAATLASPLIQQGVAFGLQLGTAYLMTEDAARSGAIPNAYLQTLANAVDTTLVGVTVNLPSQWAANSTTLNMLQAELDIEALNIPLIERKKRLEKLSLHALDAAIQTNETSGAAYMCGQIITVQNQSRSIQELHEALTVKARQLAEQCPTPIRPRPIPEDGVAIIGIGCIFPNAHSPAKYWDNIIHRLSAIQEVPIERWDPAIYYHPDRSARDKSYCKIGAFIQGFQKNPLKFRIPPVSASSIDEIQFLTLEATHQALTDAGLLDKDFPRERTMFFIGNESGGILPIFAALRAYWNKFSHILKTLDYLKDTPEEFKETLLRQIESTYKQGMPELCEDSCAGAFDSMVSGRIANCFNLGGSWLSVQGACASSLASVDIGVRALREGRADLVIAGGADVRIDPTTYLLFCSLGALSAQGSFPFDERADGFVLGEGAGIIVLKRLKEAIQDSDKIYAVIRGMGCSSDGRAKGMTAPDAQGQIRALENAYQGLSFGPNTLSLIEAHGTATREGDITELTSLTAFIRRFTNKNHSIALGSVKSMIGHLKAASGIAGLIKVALALHHKVIPPTINCEQPRKDYDWQTSPLYLIAEARPWEASIYPRRAAVDAFGFGGINYHAILEEAPTESTVKSDFSHEKIDVKTQSLDNLPARLLVFRQPTRTELHHLLHTTLTRARQNPSDAFTNLEASMPKDEFSQCPTLAIVASQPDELTTSLEKAIALLKDPSRKEFTLDRGVYFSEQSLALHEKIGFLFPGQGSQYIGMGGDLPLRFPFIKQIFHQIDQYAQGYLKRSIMPFLTPQEDMPEDIKAQLAELLIYPQYNHPTILALGMGIFEAFRKCAILPAMTAGHSLGEYLALWSAGVFDGNDAIRIVSWRGVGLNQDVLNAGIMASVVAPTEKITPFLERENGLVVVANKNCYLQTVIAGPEDAVKRVLKRLEQEEISYQILQISTAFHTPLLSLCVEPFRKRLEQYAFKKPRFPVQSNLLGRPYDTPDDFDCYMRDGLAKHLVAPVEFIQNVLSMYEHGVRLFVEIGPGSTLCSFVDNILADKPHWCAPTNLPRRSASLQLLHALAFCAARGIPVDLNSITTRSLKSSQIRIIKHYSIEKTQKTEIEVKAPSSDSPSWIVEALKNHPQDVIDRYLKDRAAFLQEMLQLDFKHYLTQKNYGSHEKETPQETPAHMDKLETALVALISRLTGYPTEMIGLDMDVEAELGIDSIKQVEIIRAFAQEIGVEVKNANASKRYRMTTLRSLLNEYRKLAKATPLEDNTEEIKKIETFNLSCHRWTCK